MLKRQLQIPFTESEYYIVAVRDSIIDKQWKLIRTIHFDICKYLLQYWMKA